MTGKPYFSGCIFVNGGRVNFLFLVTKSFSKICYHKLKSQKEFIYTPVCIKTMKCCDVLACVLVIINHKKQIHINYLIKLKESVSTDLRDRTVKKIN